ncbi:MAG: extracellular solute-binding protein [Actinobacteria bacterium]|nr:extracellular solute-binding protein [Actinomycetota bacterium]
MTASLRRLLALLCVLALAAAGCGDDDDGDNGAAPTGGGGDDLEVPTNVGGSMEVSAVWSGEEQAAFKQVLDAFTARTGTTVTFTSTGDDIATALRTRLAGGSPPDVAILPQPGLLRDLAGQNALQPIEEAAGRAIDRNWADDWRTLGTVNNQLYGLFYKAANKSTVWYNVGAFRTAGVEPPETFDELMRIAGTIRDSGIPPFSIGGGDGWVLTDLFENIYIRQAGPEKYDQLTTHDIPWTDPSVKEALRTMARVLDPALVNGSAVSTTFVQSVDNVFKKPPAAAMVIEGDFVPGVATVPAEPETDYNVFDFPSVGGSDPMVVGGGDAVVMMKDTPQARAFLTFLTTAEAAEIWARQGGFASPNKAVDEAAYANAIQRRNALALANAETFRFDMSDLAPAAFGGTVGRGEWAILQDLARNPGNVDAVATALEQAAAAAYAE